MDNFGLADGQVGFANYSSDLFSIVYETGDQVKDYDGIEPIIYVRAREVDRRASTQVPAQCGRGPRAGQPS
jgi:hypothetical protein